jgi:hypothetical protein
LISRGGVGISRNEKGWRYLIKKSDSTQTYEHFQIRQYGYIFASALQYHDVKLHKVISYDIACQWSVNLLERLKDLPPQIRPHQIGSAMPLSPSYTSIRISHPALRVSP